LPLAVIFAVITLYVLIARLFCSLGNIPLKRNAESPALSSCATGRNILFSSLPLAVIFAVITLYFVFIHNRNNYSTIFIFDCQ
jgi:hypothetical protein